MSLSLFTPSRTVLLISDDALFIYSIGARGVRLVETVPWSAENFESEVSLILSKECNGKPVLIVNDMVEQHYRKEKVPRVSVMDKQNVLKRKLHVAFPNYAVRAALPLKEKVAKTDRTMAGNVYIFAAVPATDAFQRTLEATTKSMVPIAGVVLLPIESSDMVKKLADKIFPQKEGKAARWTIFIGQHRGGGLRQIVIKDGELALTRMTPVSELDRDPNVWASDVHQEFQATMSYLSRFGFDSSDGLNIIVMSDSEAGGRVQELIDVPCNFHCMTTQDAARKVQVGLGMQDSSFFADVLHVAWVGRKSRFILPMKARQVDLVSKPRQAAVLTIILLLLGGAFQSYQLLDVYQKFVETSDSLAVAERRVSRLSIQRDAEVKRKESLGFDIRLIQASLNFYDSLVSRDIPAISLFKNIGRALGRDMRIDQIRLSRDDRIKRLVFSTGLGDAKDTAYWLTLQMTFPSNTDAEKGNQEVLDLRSRIQTLLPGYIVSVSKMLKDFEYSEEIVVETGRGADAASSKDQDYVAEIKIERPVADD
ncbi:MAG: hypothetical protein ACLFU1_00315 [Alphaproteobacteria bacterium]